MQGRLLKQTFSLSSSSSDVPRKIQNQQCHELFCLQVLTVSLPIYESTDRYKKLNILDKKYSLEQDLNLAFLQPTISHNDWAITMVSLCYVLGFFVQRRTASTWEIPLKTPHSLVAMTFPWGLWELGLNAWQKTWLQNALKEGTLNYWQECDEGSSPLQKQQQQKTFSWLKHSGEDSWLRSSSRNNITF